MKTLTVRTLNEDLVGSIIQHDDGAIEVHGGSPELEAALKQLVQTISAHPIPYRTGERKETSHGIKYVTYVKMCRQGDPEFLNALKDALNRHSLLGQRIKGIFT